MTKKEFIEVEKAKLEKKHESIVKKLEAARSDEKRLLDELRARMRKITDALEEEEYETRMQLKKFELNVIPEFEYTEDPKLSAEANLAVKMVRMVAHCKAAIDSEYIPDFSDPDEEQFYLCYDRFNKSFHVESTCWTKPGEIYFSTEEAAELAASWMTENWKECF